MLAETELAKVLLRIRTAGYLVGRKTPRQDFKSTGNGKPFFIEGCCFLRWRNSASASEIFAELCRIGTGGILGRRTFGKGLVQKRILPYWWFNDKTYIARTTHQLGDDSTAYNEGYDKYMENFYKRFTNGELMSADSIRYPIHWSIKHGLTDELYMEEVNNAWCFVSARYYINSTYLINFSQKMFLTFTLEFYDKNGHCYSQ